MLAIVGSCVQLYNCIIWYLRNIKNMLGCAYFGKHDLYTDEPVGKKKTDTRLNPLISV